MHARFGSLVTNIGVLVLALFVAACSSTSAGNTSASSTAPTRTSGPTAAEPETASSCSRDIWATIGRTDVDPSGNRQAAGALELLDAPVTTIALPANPEWVVPYFSDRPDCGTVWAPDWYVVLDDGSALVVRSDGTTTKRDDAVSPPETSPGNLRSAHDDLVQFDNPLPDSRVVSFGSWTAALVDPTDRYGHGVLGDRIEAAAVQVIDIESGQQTVIAIEAPTVIEGISPMLIDVDQPTDGIPEVLVTLSNSDVGAWLALYSIDGTLRAESTPIGRGNRWRNQLGAGWTGSAFEIVDVRTPHLDGVVEFFRVVDDQLERTASISGYTNHTIGSRNLDLGILLDADRDGSVEVVLPTRDLQSLAVIDRFASDAVELGRIELGGSLSTNIASESLGSQTWLALGTSDGRLLVIGDPQTGVVD